MTASEAVVRARRTRDHDEIRRWAEARGGQPAVVVGTEILRFDYREPDPRLRQISWDEFFRVFDHRDVEFLYQEEPQGGGKSRFFKLIGDGGDDG